MIVLGICFFLLFFLYGPFSLVRDYLITSSMTTFSHQYIAKGLYCEKDIAKVMSKNFVTEEDEITDLTAISVKKKKGLYSLKEIHGPLYQGYLVEVYDPTRIQLVTAKDLGIAGEDILSASKRSDAQVMINSVGFYDPDWSSNGSIAHGTLIQNGKVISQYGTSNVGGGFAGFTEDGKLLLAALSLEEVLKMGLFNAVQFGPYLIINGKKSVIKGNGGFGIAPRTAIGQRRDGTVLFVVINGRVPSSVGVSMKRLADIMAQYGAYNAVNMDGGSSTALVIQNKIINKPVGGGEHGLRQLPAFWMVK